MIYRPQLSYDPKEIALALENARLKEEIFKLNEELRYYKTGTNLSANLLAVDAPITEQLISNDIVLHRVAVANAEFDANNFSYHMIGRWEGGPSADDHFGYSYYISKLAFYETADKAQLVQMLLERTAHALARRIMGENK